MALSIDEQGNMSPLPNRPVQPHQPPQSAPPTASLAPRLAEYRTLLRKDRRRRYLGIAAVATGVLWLGLAALLYFDAGFPLALPLGILLTVLMPAAALLYEAVRQPTPVDTARTLDSLLDNRQRVLTSVELLNKQPGPASDRSGIQHAQSTMEAAQLTSTARLLSAVEPRTLYPARMPAVQLFVAGGLLVLAVGLWLLKGANDDFALAQGSLPPSVDTSGVIATPTADAGLPNADPGAQADPPPAGEDGTQGQQPSTLPGDPNSQAGDGNTTSNSSAQLSPEQAEQQAAQSREAEKDLQRLAQSLDAQGVTQNTADSLRQGEYDTAGNQLAELGDNNDQLSQDAKEALSESLDAAANDSTGSPALQDAERKAAEALRNGTYGEIKKALEDLGQAVKDAGDNVVPQQDLAKNFPTQSSTSTAASPSTTQESAPQSGDSQQGDSSQQGEQGQQTPQNDGSAGQPDASGSQQGEPSESASGAPANPSQSQPGAPGEQSGQGSGAGLPGEGSRVDGPGSKDLDASGDPFALEGNEAPDPNNLRPGESGDPPAMTLEGDAGGAGGATGPAQGGPIDATGETAPAPIDRWGILQRYFSPEAR